MCSSDLSIAAVNDGRQVAPSILPTKNVGRIDSPSLVRSARDTSQSLRPRTLALGSTPDLPPIDSNDSADFLAIHAHFMPVSQYSRNPSNSVSRILVDDLADQLH